MTNSAFGKQIQNRNFLSGVAFKFNLAKFPKVDFFSNSAIIPVLNLELAQQASYLKNIDVPGERQPSVILLFVFSLMKIWKTINQFMIG